MTIGATAGRRPPTRSAARRGRFGRAQVRLDSGQEKMAVPEEELFDAQDADDPNFGVHFAAALAAAMEAEMLDSACGGCDFYD